MEKMLRKGAEQPLCAMRARVQVCHAELASGDTQRRTQQAGEGRARSTPRELRREPREVTTADTGLTWTARARAPQTSSGVRALAPRTMQKRRNDCQEECAPRTQDGTAVTHRVASVRCVSPRRRRKDRAVAACRRKRRPLRHADWRGARQWGALTRCVWQGRTESCLQNTHQCSPQAPGHSALAHSSHPTPPQTRNEPPIHRPRAHP